MKKLRHLLVHLIPIELNDKAFQIVSFFGVNEIHIKTFRPHVNNITL